jgi:hypothetical protein
MVDSIDYCWNNTRHSISNHMVKSLFCGGHGIFGFMYRFYFHFKDHIINKEKT